MRYSASAKYHFHSRAFEHVYQPVTLSNAAVMVKLSDFGLHKDPQSPITRTESEIRGTIVDPTITNFRDYPASSSVAGRAPAAARTYLAFDLYRG